MRHRQIGFAGVADGDLHISTLQKTRRKGVGNRRMMGRGWNVCGLVARFKSLLERHKMTDMVLGADIVIDA